jgi:uncharacterized membrane protein
MREIISPNLHVVLMHTPLALLVIGTVIELFAFLWRESTFRTAGRWMILLGALAMIPVATSGIYAARDVMGIGGYPAYWEELKQSARLDQEQWSMLESHVWLNGAATLLAVVVVLTCLGASDLARRKFHWVFLVALLLAVGVMLAGAYVGGEMVYTKGVAVGPKPEAPVNAPEIDKINVAIEPMQIHLIAAGFTIALALAALALSARAITVRSVLDEDRDPADPAAGDIRSAFSSAREFANALAPYVPSTRFWLLAALGALLTAGGGAYLLATNANQWDPNELWKLLSDTAQPRRLAHAAGGSAILVLTLILAAASRWAPRNRGVLGVLAALLILAIVVQLWVGLLLLFDSPDGPLHKPTPAIAPPTTIPAT